jgi:hypothetical protein
VQDISHANWRLENPPPVDIDVPKWIGLLVVSRLAARRGARVRLQHAELGGLTALVWIPDELIARPDMRVRPEFTRRGPDGPRRGAHESAMNLRGVGAQRITTATRVAEPVASREEVRSALPSRRLISEEALPGPAGPPAAPGPVPQAAPAMATAGLQQETASGDSAVVVSAPVSTVEERRLPIYEAIESSWFSGARRTPASARTAVHTAGQWSSPADEGWRAAQTVEAPAAGSPTEAGLPRRVPNANLVPGAVPGSQPAVALPSRSAADVRDRLAGLQRGVAQGRAAASEAGKSAGDNES